MRKNIGLKYRIYPNKEQVRKFVEFFGCVRFVYNHYLAVRRDADFAENRNVTYYETARDLVGLKKEYTFLKDADSICLQQALRHLDTAFRNFSRDRSIGYPRFKSRKHGHDSYTTVRINDNIRVEGKHITLPKIGKVRIRLHRDIPEGYEIKSVTVSKTPTDKYYVSLQCEYACDAGDNITAQNEVSSSDSCRRAVGLDYSMTDLFVSSDEALMTDPGYLHRFRKSEERLAREQRKLSHCVRGSRNYDKQKKIVAVVHEKIANQRRDYLHKLSRKIANSYDIVCIETLDMKAMAGEGHYGKSVSDNGWGMFTRMLDYKLEDMGKCLVKVDKYYPSTKTCHDCGHIRQDITIDIREWECPVCGRRHDRDRNASLNIKDEGLRILMTEHNATLKEIA